MMMVVVVVVVVVGRGGFHNVPALSPANGRDERANNERRSVCVRVLRVPVLTLFKGGVVTGGTTPGNHPSVCVCCFVVFVVFVVVVVVVVVVVIIIVVVIVVVLLISTL